MRQKPIHIVSTIRDRLVHAMGIVEFTVENFKPNALFGIRQEDLDLAKVQDLVFVVNSCSRR